MAERVLGLIDLTNLDESCTRADVERLCARANGPRGSVAAVCVWPRFVSLAKQCLRGTSVTVATVANFPGGNDDQESVLALVAQCVRDGADDVDVVLPYRRLMAGERAAVEEILDAVRSVVPGNVHLKVILETGELVRPDLIELAARLAIDHGADFVKTSTGKTSTSATPQSVTIMLHAIRDSGRPVGIKPSGGIRSLDDAIGYLDLADDIMGPTWANRNTFRFGASGLLDAVESALNESPPSGDGRGQ